MHFKLFEDVLRIILCRSIEKFTNLMRERKESEASQLLKDIFCMEINRSFVHYMLGVYYFYKKQWLPAIKHLTHSRKLDHSFALPLLMLARIARIHKNFSKAKEYLFYYKKNKQNEMNLPFLKNQKK